MATHTRRKHGTSTASTVSSPAHLTQLKRGIRALATGQAETMQAFTALHHAATRSGALDAKTKELMALAIGVAARCDGCMTFHTHDALRAGATKAEMLEA
jgi:AhpD family alkylhydroperoxidase